MKASNADSIERSTLESGEDEQEVVLGESRSRGSAEGSLKKEVTSTGRPNSLLDMYLAEISGTPLLTAEEEVELAHEIARGNTEARERMVKSNLRLVVKIAKDFEGFGVQLLDLINEGNIGLTKAADRFDPEKGCRFCTYASLWIKQSIKRALTCSARTIRLPVHAFSQLTTLLSTSHKLENELGRRPSDLEVAERAQVPVTQVSHLLAVATRPTSMDASYGEDDERSIGEVVADENAMTPYAVLEKDTTLDLAEGLVDRLCDREKHILIRRFGLRGEAQRTLEELGQELGLTRERIRQLQNAALGKLREMMNEVEALPTSAALA